MPSVEYYSRQIEEIVLFVFETMDCHCKYLAIINYVLP